MVRVFCACMVCQVNLGRPCGHSEFAVPTQLNCTEIICPHSRGVTFTINQGFRYELWAEEALLGFGRADYALSVSSLYTALERFNELVCKWCLVVAGLSDKDVLLAWKSVSSLSERQRGALMICQAIARHNGFDIFEVPKLDKVSRLRNDVVHGGFFPTAEEARKNMGIILDYMQSTITCLLKDDEALKRVTFLEMQPALLHAKTEIERRGLSPEQSAVSTASFAYQLSMHRANRGRDLDSMVRECVELNNRFSDLTDELKRNL